jgi:hypothetical protein
MKKRSLLSLLVATAALMLAMPGVADGVSPTWSTAALRWTAPGPADSYLNEVSCTSARCVAVGDAVDSSGVTMPVVEQRSASSWTRLPERLPAGTTGLQWLSVSCGAATSCEGVGQATVPSGTAMVALALTGMTLVVSDLPTLQGWSDEDVASISCPSSTSCTAVGYATSAAATIPIVETLSNGTWTPSEPASAVGSTDATLANVSCVDATDCTADGFRTDASDVTVPMIAEEVAGTWSAFASTPPTGVLVNVIAEISCWSATTCDAVGESGTGTGIVLSITGTAVSYVELANLGSQDYEELTSIRCFSATSCIAVGTTGGGGSIVSAGTSRALVSVLTGSTWSQRLLPNPSSDNDGIANSISCTSASSCVAVGTAGDVFGGPAPPPSTYAAYGAALATGTWSLDAPSVGGAPQAALFGMSCPAPGTCLSVGRALTETGLKRPILESLTSGRWALAQLAMPAGATSAGLYAISCPKAGSCVAVGRYVARSGAWLPYVDVLDAGRWKPTAVPGKAGFINVGLFGVSCVSITWCVAVGAASMNTSPSPYCSVNCGEAPVVEQLVGTRWTEHTPPSPSQNTNPILSGVSCWAPEHCVAVGTYFDSGFNGNVETLVGTKWRWSGAGAPSGGAEASLDGVACVSATRCLLVGDFDETATTSQYPLVESGPATGPFAPSAPTGTATAMVAGAFGGIACRGATCLAAGTDGTHAIVGELVGSTWSTEALALPLAYATETLHAVACPRTGNCQASGELFSSTANPPAVAGQ